jgi:hypothetical protein
MPRRRPIARAAGYDQTTGRYTGQRPFDDPWMRELMDVGRQFWASRNVTLPENVGLHIADDLSGPDTEGTPGRVIARGRSPRDNGEAWVAFDADFIENRLRRARSRKLATKVRRAALRELSSKLLHEQGHVGDVPHVEGDEAGMMGAFGAGDLVPQEVASAVRRLVKRRPGEKARRGIYGVG